MDNEITVAATLITQRIEILSAFRTNIKNGHVPTTKEVQDLVQALLEELLGLVDLLEQSIEDWNKVTKLQKELTATGDLLRETSRHLDRRAFQMDSISKDFNAIDKSITQLWQYNSDELQ